MKTHLKEALSLFIKLVKVLFPRSRWGNVIYLFAGYYLAHSNELTELIKEFLLLFSK